MRAVARFVLALLGVAAGCVSVARGPRVTERAMVIGAQESLPVPAQVASWIADITASRLGGGLPETSVDEVAPGIFRLRLRYQLTTDVTQDDWHMEITPAMAPSFHWAPHLAPTAEHVIDQHSFRSPALIVGDQSQVLAIVPDLELLARQSSPHWYLDLDAPANKLILGMSNTAVREHVLYVRKPGAHYRRGTLEVGCYVFTRGKVADPFREVLAFLWERWGRARFEMGEPLAPDLGPYVAHTYRWAFDTWGKSVWQEFKLGGTVVGAPAFIVNQTQSPNFPGTMSEREFRSVWNQAWFSSLRSASGLFRYARRTKDPALELRAKKTKELALAAPQEHGLFPSVIATEMERIDVGGQQVKRSKGWATAFWGNSDRNPVNRPAVGASSNDVRLAPYHLLDMSWTALHMLRWFEELEPDARLVDYARRYGDALLSLQRSDGFFPAWLDEKTQKPLGVLDDSAETSVSVTFLLTLARVTGDERYRRCAFTALEAVTRSIIQQGRWQDFETFWSCAPWGQDSLIGRRVARNAMFKQSNLTMFWTAEALLEAHRASQDARYLALGQRVLDELLMTQASWQPPYMHVNVLGGFGVMNADGEWNDSRSSLFAELVIRYGIDLGNDEYVQRGLAAMRSSFVMMYCPENPKTRAQWQTKYPWMKREDYGFTMENYGHDGVTAPDATGMGEFTIYDWGNGAAAEGYNRLLDHFGPDLVLRAK